MARLSTELRRFFFEDERPQQVTLTDILALAGERAFGILLLLISLPSALPIPAPGYSIPFGILIIFLAGQLMLGSQTPWLPQGLQRRSIPLSTTQTILEKGLPWLQRLETITRPRLTGICTSLAGRVVIGTAISLMGLSMMIPIPGTNTLPAMAVLLTSFSLVEDDGAITLAGLTLCLLAFLLSTAIIITLILTGASFVELLKQWLKQASIGLIPVFWG
jgi:hypothetical protein